MNHIGYMELIRRFNLRVLEPWLVSFQGEGTRRTEEFDGKRTEYHLMRVGPDALWTEHLEFALKSEGVNLEILAALFKVAPRDELVAWIKAAPTGRFTRIAWFLAEWLTGDRLPLDDIEMGNYVEVLDPEKYFALPKSGRELNCKRQRIINNLPGTAEYCPLVRRSAGIQRFESMGLDVRAREQLADFPEDMIVRATHYLYLRETKSSFAIENENPDQQRTARFVALLREAGGVDCYDRAELIRLQNATVEPRYAADDFRSTQNYVGQSIAPGLDHVLYIPPRPGDLDSLMAGWVNCCDRMHKNGVHPVITAAVAGFGFVYLHPFEDGNGRLHRFIIHHVLAAGSFAPPGLIFPVSAAMLMQRDRYFKALDSYSKPLMKQVEFQMAEPGNLRVTNETVSYYRFPDFTLQTEALFGFIQDTIEKEMLLELKFLRVFDASRKRVAAIVDMPDRRLELFIRLCLQGNGKLSKRKREQFGELTDVELTAMENAIQEELQKGQEQD